MNPATLLNLVARVEAATGPDHALDAEIICALRGYTIHVDTDPANGTFAFWYGEPGKSACSNCSSWPDYTASLDAAMTLAEGLEWCGGAGGMLREAMDRMSGLPDMVSLMSPEGYRQTLARFFTAACLRARAASGGEQ